MTQQPDVLIIGAGPSGLAAAVALRRSGVERVLVVDRESQAGGVPRHCNHTGFGLRDVRRVLTGPDYARRNVQLAEAAGVEILTNTMVTEWRGATGVRTTRPSGVLDIQAAAIVLATGCRERPRSARLVPGARPAGIFTTGALQQWVYLQRHPVGKRAVIVGAEHVSFSAVMTLKHAGLDVIAMLTDLPRHQSFLAYKLIGADRWRVPLLTNTRMSAILGKQRVEGVEIADVNTGAKRILDCDTVVFTGDWIPDHELARSGNLTMDSPSRSPQVDSLLRTSVPGVFAAGNLLHAADTADLAALSGRYVAESVVNYLQTQIWRDTDLIPITFDSAVRWVSPHVIQPDNEALPNHHLSLRVAVPLEKSTIEIWQGKQRLWARRYRRLTPNLPVYLPDTFLKEMRTAEAIRIIIRPSI